MAARSGTVVEFKRRGKTAPKTMLTVRRQIQELERMAEDLDQYDDEDRMRARAMRYALLWQQGRASQPPSSLVREMSTVDGP